jgi:hypothetical protein
MGLPFAGLCKKIRHVPRNAEPLFPPYTPTVFSIDLFRAPLSLLQVTPCRQQPRPLKSWHQRRPCPSRAKKWRREARSTPPWQALKGRFGCSQTRKGPMKTWGLSHDDDFDSGTAPTTFSQTFRLRAAKPMPSKPRPSRPKVAGSGT